MYFSLSRRWTAFTPGCPAQEHELNQFWVSAEWLTVPSVMKTCPHRCWFHLSSRFRDGTTPIML